MTKFKHITSRREFGKILQELIPNGLGVEVGVQRGEYSEMLLTHWKSGTIHSIDRWLHVPGYQDIANYDQAIQESFFRETEARLSKFGNRSKIIRKDSVDAAADYANESLEFVYIDAEHTYEACLRDIKLWYPKVKSGGIISGHDYLNGHLTAGIFGVKKAVDEFFSERIQDLNLLDVDTGWPTWWVIK